MIHGFTKYLVPAELWKVDETSVDSVGNPTMAVTKHSDIMVRIREFSDRSREDIYTAEHDGNKKFVRFYTDTPDINPQDVIKYKGKEYIVEDPSNMMGMDVLYQIDCYLVE